MKSYRASLSKIGVTQGPISYRAFYSRPAKLSDAMRAMESPGQSNEVFEVSRSDDWAQDCQGGTFDGKFTILVSNSKKTMYGFLNHSELHDADQTFNFKSITGLPFSLYSPRGSTAEMSVILVRAELKKDLGGGKQPYDELEGTWHHSVHWDDGRRAQVHVILLENNWPHDNAFYKSYQAEYPEFV